RGLSRLECHAGSMTQTNGWRNADYCYCHAKQNPGRLWRPARACCMEPETNQFSLFFSHRHGRDARVTLENPMTRMAIIRLLELLELGTRLISRRTPKAHDRARLF
ncbi:MAG TPA: hypothetical protein VFC78_04995, partial [Tepidisphaeraceae bacterium]|nr:hypothetical protein [Tepidisphaeraceae bacterium]